VVDASSLTGPFPHGIKYVAITGTPAAGKSTLAADLQREFKLPVVSAGEAARSIDAGSLITGAMAAEDAFRSEWQRRMALLHDGPAILEGIPRKFTQCDLLPPLTLVFVLLTSWEVAEGRSKSRGRLDDGHARDRYEEQLKLFGMVDRVKYVETWVTKLATPDRVVVTDWMQPDQVARQVIDYLRGKRTTAW
jgi:broad-specificity NMP kinase